MQIWAKVREVWSYPSLTHRAERDASFGLSMGKHDCFLSKSFLLCSVQFTESLMPALLQTTGWPTAFPLPHTSFPWSTALTRKPCSVSLGADLVPFNQQRKSGFSFCFPLPPIHHWLLKSSWYLLMENMLALVRGGKRGSERERKTGGRCIDGRVKVRTIRSKIWRKLVWYLTL